MKGNYINEAKRRQIEAGLDEGLSICAVSRLSGCCVATVRRYIRLRGGKRGKCGCGDDPSHQGWCWYRYKQSPERQAFIATWEPIARGPAPRPIPAWPFERTSLEVDLVAAVNEAVPKWMFPDERDEVCQDLCVAVITGEIALDEVGASVKQFHAAVRRRYPTSHGPASLTQRTRRLSHGGAWTLLDVLADPSCDTEYLDQFEEVA